MGVIFGVAAVITMVSIGEGSKRQAILQLEQLGATNIIIRSQKPPENQQAQGGQQRSWILRYGLTRDDLTVIQQFAPPGAVIVPLKEFGAQVLRGDRRQGSQAFGTTPDLLRVANLRVGRGRYLSPTDVEDRAMVAVIGTDVARRLFPFDDPLGETLRIDDKAFTVVGILAPVGYAGGSGATLIGRDLNLDVHVPITTARAIYNDIVVRRESGSFQASEVQLSEIYVNLATRGEVLEEAAKIQRILDVRHDKEKDVAMRVPFELLANARKVALTWTGVLGLVAGISLLVGGIGIMNIMLATVTERTREIGVRRALGATRRHIVWQFLVETGVLSAIGGLLGIGLGILLSVFIGWVVPRLSGVPVFGKFFPDDADLPTKITLWSILLSYAVAAATGLIFGLFPAIKAAKQDPIVALRHD